MEGGVVERLKHSSKVVLDQYLLHAGFVYEECYLKELRKIYFQYTEIALKYQFPILILTPTWRATEQNISQSKYKDHNVNADCAKMLINIKKGSDTYNESVFVGGMMSCKGDTYKAKEALEMNAAEKFHSYQAHELAAAGVDFLYASGMPAISEAIGMAKAMSATDKPYIISFIVYDTGHLLDGTPLYDAIKSIDDQVQTPPYCYMLTCVHPRVFSGAVKSQPADIFNRLIGIQANTSWKRPEELDLLEQLDVQEPLCFAREMAQLYDLYGLKIFGGCCGSDNRHMEAIAKHLRRIVPA